MLLWCLIEGLGKRLLFLLINGVVMLTFLEGFGVVAALKGLRLKSA